MRVPEMKDLRNCVVCERRLKLDRKHVDTCGEGCFKELLKKQRRKG